MAARNLKDAPLSEAAGLGASFIRDLRRKKSSPKTVNAARIARALNMTIDEVLGAADGHMPAAAIPIVGTVGAGAQVPVFEAYEPGAGPRVACPPGLPDGGLVAVEVKGDSMEPVYFAGDLLFYRRDAHDGVPSEAVGRTCVCEDEGGMGWVKQVKRGSEPGLFHLVALNPQAENIHDIRLKWAAPVRLHWPAELVRKL